MQYDWINNTQNKLAGPYNNMLTPVQNMQQSGQNNMLQPLQQMQQPQKLRTGKNPNPRFPRLRHAWENTKEGASNVIFGKPEGVEQYSELSPQQQGIMQLLQDLGIYDLQNPYEGFDEGIANPAWDEFNQQTVPNLAESFTSMTNGAMSSPSFAAQLGQAGAGLKSNLSAQRAQYGQQNKQQALNQLMSLVNPNFSENIHRPRQPGAIERGFETAFPLIMKALMAGAI